MTPPVVVVELKLFDGNEKFEEKVFVRLVDDLISDSRGMSVDDVLDFLVSGVVELIQQSPESFKRLLRCCDFSLRSSFKFHVLISAAVSYLTVVNGAREEEGLMELLLNVVVFGLTAVESETLSLSGSSLVKLLQWDRVSVSRFLVQHPDFISILTADMAAMFSGSENNLQPFVRIVRFCELIIALSNPNSQLKEALLQSIQSEFIEKVYRTTLRSIYGQNPLQWGLELLRVCHRGNELVIPLIEEIFSELRDLSSPEFVEMLRHERSRQITSITKLLFHTDGDDCGKLKDTAVIRACSQNTLPLDDLNATYSEYLSSAMESFDRFRVPEEVKCEISSLTPLGQKVMESDFQVLQNWLPYCLKVCEINSVEDDDLELKMAIDICSKLSTLLDL